MSMKAKPGHKFVMTFTFPSGQKYGAGSHEGKLIFIPIKEDGILRGVIAWDDTEDLNKWWRASQAKSEPKEWANLLTLKPEIGQVRIQQ